MRDPREALPGEVAPYWEKSKLHEFVGDLKITFGLLALIALGLTLFLLLFHAEGILLGVGLLIFAAGGWVTVAVIDAKGWKEHRSARDAAEQVAKALAASAAGRDVGATAPPGAGPGDAPAAPTAPGAPAAAAGAAPGARPEPGESTPRTETTAAPATATPERQVLSGGRVLLGFALVALVLASALIGSNRLALGLLLFFVLVIFYGWPFLISALGAGDRER
jgi:hypothetical protein